MADGSLSRSFSSENGLHSILGYTNPLSSLTPLGKVERDCYSYNRFGCGSRSPHSDSKEAELGGSTVSPSWTLGHTSGHVRLQATLAVHQFLCPHAAWLGEDAGYCLVCVLLHCTLAYSPSFRPLWFICWRSRVVWGVVLTFWTSATVYLHCGFTGGNGVCTSWHSSVEFRSPTQIGFHPLGKTTISTELFHGEAHPFWHSLFSVISVVRCLHPFTHWGLQNGAVLIWSLYVFI